MQASMQGPTIDLLNLELPTLQDGSAASQEKPETGPMDRSTRVKLIQSRTLTSTTF